MEYHGLLQEYHYRTLRDCAGEIFDRLLNRGPILKLIASVWAAHVVALVVAVWSTCRSYFLQIIS